jgi:hypothetical protein
MQWTAETFYGGHHNGKSRWDSEIQPLFWFGKLGVAAVVVAKVEPHSYILEYLLAAHKVTMKSYFNIIV